VPFGGSETIFNEFSSRKKKGIGHLTQAVSAYFLVLSGISYEFLKLKHNDH